MKQLAIGTPHTRSFTPEYVGSLAHTFGALQNVAFNIGLYMNESCYVHMNRNIISEKAHLYRDDFLLFIDTDMQWVAEDIMTLVKLNNEKSENGVFPCVSTGVYYKRTAPITSTIYKYHEGKGLYPVTDFPEHAFRCDACGTGFMLINRATIQRVYDNINEYGLPFDFHLATNPEQKTREFRTRLAGEDISFCAVLRDLGIPIWVAPSVNLIHIGAMKVSQPAHDALNADFLKIFDKKVLQHLRDFKLGYNEGALFENSFSAMSEQIRFLTLILQKINPKVILETGTYRAHFAYFVSRVLQSSNGIEIDTYDKNVLCGQLCRYVESLHENVRVFFHHGDTKDLLQQITAHDYDFAWIDGGHDYETCYNDLTECARLQIKHICVDDFNLYSSVRVAVHNFLNNNKLYQLVSHSDFHTDQRGIVYLKKGE